MHTVVFDEPLFYEKILVHYGGDASRMISSVRSGMMLTNSDDIMNFINAVEHNEIIETDGELEGCEICGIKNRFRQPASSGYRDFKFYVKESNGLISVGRIVSEPFEKHTFFKTSQQAWMLALLEARKLLSEKDIWGPIVLISDNYLRDEEDSIHVVAGFPNEKSALQYGLDRFNRSLWRLKEISSNAMELIDNWMLFGENVSVETGKTMVAFDETIEARMLNCDIIEKPIWNEEKEEQYFKMPIVI